MKNLLILAALILSLAPVASAAPTRGRDKAFAVPAGAGEGGPDSQAVWSLPVTARNEFTTTASNPVDGKLLLRAICSTSTGTVGAYTAVYDTDNANGLLLGSNANGLWLTNIVTKLISSVGSDTAKQSCEWFPRGIPTQYGLAWINSDANIRVSVIYDKIAD